MADWSILEQKFEDGFEKLYKVLGLPFERNAFLHADFSANDNSYRSVNYSNTAESEGKQNWNSPSSVLMNDQNMEGDEKPTKPTPFMEEGKEEVKKLKGTSSICSNASESNTYEETKHDSLIDEGSVQNSREKNIREDSELNNNITTTIIRSESSGKAGTISELARNEGSWKKSPYLKVIEKASDLKTEQIDCDKFTKEAWEAIADALTVANNMQQKAETQHLMKALLEQNQGLVPYILAKVSIDVTLLLKITNEFIQCQPKNIGKSNGSVLGMELEALLQRAIEWKEEYGDSLVSTEHLLHGFNLDKRIGKQLYKEGTAVDISLNILDAIDVVRRTQLFMNPEENHEVLQNNLDGENQEGEDDQGMKVREIEHGIKVLNVYIKIEKLIGRKGGYGELIVDGTKASICKALVAYKGAHNLVGEQLAKGNPIRLVSTAPTLFDEMSSRWGQCFGKARTLEFFTSRKFNLTMDLLKKMKKKNVIAWTSQAWHVQSGGSNLVKFLQEMPNASTEFLPRRIDHDWWGYDFVVVLVRETLAFGQLEKECYASSEELIGSCFLSSNIHRLKVQDVIDKVNMWAPYLHRKPQITRNLVALEELNSIIGYAIKVKTNFQILKHLRKLGCGVVLVNSDELGLALLTGFDATRCLFNRNGKLLEDLVLAIQEGVLVNVDSELNLDNIVSAAIARNKVNVLVRINSDVLVKAHCHLGSTTTKVDIFRNVAVLVVNYIDQIRSQVFETDHLSIRVGLEIDSYHIGVILLAARDLLDIVHELVLLRNLKVIIGPRKLVLCDSIVTAEVTKKTKVFVFDPGGSQSRKEGLQG